MKEGMTRLRWIAQGKALVCSKVGVRLVGASLSQRLANWIGGAEPRSQLRRMI